MSRNFLRNLAIAHLALLLLAGQTFGGLIWDAGGVADTSIDTAANWDGDTLPALTDGTSNLSFGTAGSTANINVPVTVNSVTFTRNANNFTLARGAAGHLTIGAGGIIGDNSGSTARGYAVAQHVTTNGAQTWETKDQYSKLTVTGDVSITGGDLTLKTYDNAASIITLSGVVSGNQALFINGRAQFNYTNTYTGDTTLGPVGNLVIGYANAIPYGAGKGNVVMNDSSADNAPVLNLNGYDININGLSGADGGYDARVMNNGGGAKELIVGNNDASASFSGKIINRTTGSGTVWLTKVGAGTQTLTSPDHAYTGKTRIYNGTLALSGGASIATSSAIEIALGAIFDVSTESSTYTLVPAQTLKGSGTVLGAMIVAGTLSPGDSVGTLITANETWTVGGNYLWELNSAAGVAGANPGWDAITMGALSLTATPAAPFKIAVTSLTSGNVAGPVFDFDGSQSYSWKIASTAGITGWDVPDGAASSLFALNTTGFANTVSPLGQWSVSKTGNDVFLNYAVPEPGTFLLLAAGLFGLLAFSRPSLRKIASKLGFTGLVIALLGAQASAGVVWDAGGGTNTNIDTATNWDGDALPALTDGTSNLSFSTAGAAANINVPVNVNSVTFNRNAAFSLERGAGWLTIGTGGIIADNVGTTARNYTIKQHVTTNGVQTWETKDQYSRLTVTGDVGMTGGDLTLKTYDSAGSTITFSGEFSGNQTVNILGRVLYNWPATYTGDTTIGPVGNLTAGYANPLPYGAGKGNVIMDNTETNNAPVLGLGGFDVRINGLSGAAGTYSARVLNNGGGPRELIVGYGNATAAFAGTILDRTSGTGTVWLSKVGSGTQTLSGNNTYTGKTRIYDGTLALKDSGSIAASSEILLCKPAATLDVTQLTVPTLNLGGTQSLVGAGTIKGNVASASGSFISPSSTANCQVNLAGGTMNITDNLALGAGENLQFKLTGNLTPGPLDAQNDKIVVSGDLNMNFGSTNVSIVPNTSLAEGTYTLLTANTASNPGSFNLGTNNTRYTMLLDNTTDPTKLYLQVSGTNADLRWNGGTAGTWDVISNQNWLDSTETPAFFYQADAVTFGSVADTAATVVTLNAVVYPASITVNSAQDYTISGTGRITGGAGILKQGDGTLIVNTTGGNNFTGAVNITGGTLKVGNSRTLGSDASSTYVVDGGTVINGGTLDLNSQDVRYELINVQGTGVGGNGAIVNSGATEVNLYYVTLDAAATFGGTQNWKMDGPASNSAMFPAYLHGSDQTLTKKGANTITLSGLGETNLGDVRIDEGEICFQGNTTLGNTAGGKRLYLANGAQLGLLNSTASHVKGITVAASGGAIDNKSGNNTLNSDIMLDGVLSVNGATNTSLTLGGILSGTDGGLTVNTVKVTLGGANTYHGPTLIETGTLELPAGGEIASATITNKATFQVSGVMHTLGAIDGSGTMNVLSGELTVNSIAQNTLVIGAAAAPTAAVPEPAAWLLLALGGMIGCGLRRMRRP